ncbi:MAG: flagellar hook-length control protein FliK [Syntrophomonadaceae bacterium]
MKSGLAINPQPMKLKFSNRKPGVKEKKVLDSQDSRFVTIMNQVMNPRGAERAKPVGSLLRLEAGRINSEPSDMARPRGEILTNQGENAGPNSLKTPALKTGSPRELLYLRQDSISKPAGFSGKAGSTADKVKGTRSEPGSYQVVSPLGSRGEKIKIIQISGEESITRLNPLTAARPSPAGYGVDSPCSTGDSKYSGLSLSEKLSPDSLGQKSSVSVGERVIQKETLKKPGDDRGVREYSHRRLPGDYTAGIQVINGTKGEVKEPAGAPEGDFKPGPKPGQVNPDVGKGADSTTKVQKSERFPADQPVQGDRPTTPEDMNTAAGKLVPGSMTLKAVTIGEAGIQPVTFPEFLTKLVEQIKLSGNGKNSAIEIQLKPEYLGTLKVLVHSVDGQISVQFTAENPETVNLLNSSLQQIRDNLEQQGIRLGNLEISLSYPGHQGRSFGSDKENPDYSWPSSIMVSGEPIEIAERGPYQINYLA